MDTVIVYVDDAAHAQQVLAPMFAGDAAARTHWVLVACAPRATHRVSKWVSHSAREQWRSKWAAKLFAQLLPAMPMPNRAAQVTTVVAKGPLAELVAQLQASQPRAAQVVDARRPKTDAAQEAAPAAASRPPLSGTLASMLAGFGALWVLGLE